MGAAASVERALAAAPDQLSRAACDELAARHGVAVKDSLFDVLGAGNGTVAKAAVCLLYTSPSPRDRQKSRMPSSA